MKLAIREDENLVDQITIGVFAQIFCGIVTDEPGRSRKTAGSSEAMAASPAIGNYPVAVQPRRRQLLIP